MYGITFLVVKRPRACLCGDIPANVCLWHVLETTGGKKMKKKEKKKKKKGFLTSLLAQLSGWAVWCRDTGAQTRPEGTRTSKTSQTGSAGVDGECEGGRIA